MPGNSSFAAEAFFSPAVVLSFSSNVLAERSVVLSEPSVADKAFVRPPCDSCKSIEVKLPAEAFIWFARAEKCQKMINVSERQHKHFVWTYTCFDQKSSALWYSRMHHYHAL